MYSMRIIATIIQLCVQHLQREHILDDFATKMNHVEDTGCIGLTMVIASLFMWILKQLCSTT